MTYCSFTVIWYDVCRAAVLSAPKIHRLTAMMNFLQMEILSSFVVTEDDKDKEQDLFSVLQDGRCWTRWCKIQFVSVASSSQLSSETVRFCSGYQVIYSPQSCMLCCSGWLCTVVVYSVWCVLMQIVHTALTTVHRLHNGNVFVNASTAMGYQTSIEQFWHRLSSALEARRTVNSVNWARFL